MVGPPPGTVELADHTYTTPGDYSIAVSGSVTSGNCSFFGGTLQFTLLASQFTCPQLGQTSQVTLPAVDVPVADPGKPWSISYGELPITFTAVAAGDGAKCTVRSGTSALPVYLNVLGVPIHVADSVTTATLDFFPANATPTWVPSCDFSGLQGLLNPARAPSPGALSKANKCLLTSTAHSSTGIIARWSSPGFCEQLNTPVGSPQVWSTQPLTFYVDLDALNGGVPAQSVPFDTEMQNVETYIHTRLIANLPMIDSIGVVQDPPAHLLVTDPAGRTVGLGKNGVTKNFPGAGYLEVGDRSFAWILEPLSGRYHVTASGTPGAPFHTEFTIVQLLGHGNNPLMQTAAWGSALNSKGLADKQFAISAASLQPTVQADQSRTRQEQNRAVIFHLDGHSAAYAPLTIQWDFGDGTHATGACTSHRYAIAGKYLPTVTVRNSLGFATTRQLRPITVTP